MSKISEERLAYQRKYHHEHKDILNKQARARYQLNREERLEKQRKYHWENREKRLAYHREYKKNHRSQAKLAEKKWRHKAKLDAFLHYSNNQPKCACCGENRFEFLTIDHINGGGRKHRNEVGGHFYEWLRRNKYPDGYRVLCMNCNFSFGCYGYCPHQGADNGLS